MRSQGEREGVTMDGERDSEGKSKTNLSSGGLSGGLLLRDEGGKRVSIEEKERRREGGEGGKPTLVRAETINQQRRREGRKGRDGKG